MNLDSLLPLKTQDSAHLLGSEDIPIRCFWNRGWLYWGEPEAQMAIYATTEEMFALLTAPNPKAFWVANLRLADRELIGDDRTWFYQKGLL